MEMVQLWVNLPARHKMSPPKYQTLTHSSIPVVNVGDGGGTLRVVAGEYSGARGPAQTFTPVNLWDLNLKKGTVFNLKVPGGATTALFILTGNVLLNGSQSADDATLVRFDFVGDEISLKAEADTTLLVLNGVPIDEPVVGYGPFVMNTQQEIRQAMEDYQNGKFGVWNS